MNRICILLLLSLLASCAINNNDFKRTIDASRFVIELDGIDDRLVQLLEDNSYRSYENIVFEYGSPEVQNKLKEAPESDYYPVGWGGCLIIRSEDEWWETNDYLKSVPHLSFKTIAEYETWVPITDKTTKYLVLKFVD